MADFSLAKTPKQYAECHRLVKQLGLKKEKLGWPTVLCYQEGKLRGFLSTVKRKDIVLAGPLVFSPPNNLNMILHLINAYEQVLFQCGMLGYYFRVDLADPGWLGLVKKFTEQYGGIEQLSSEPDEDNALWFARLFTTQEEIATPRTEVVQ